ncbi:MAG TPA: DUF1592 domain-containing protein [Gemmatales bacterium]|nr:DUF1592 domain-containing protein [Gemmatales bacterium]
MLRAGSSPVEAQAARATPPEQAADIEAHYLPLVKEFCVKCHSGPKPKGDFSLEGHRSPADLQNQPANVAKLLERLKDQSMPPEGEPAPSAEQRRQVVTALERIQRAATAHPGRVTIRRLNRAEYNNTIRDLLGVHFKPADDFPGDEVGYGFDHIGDVLSMSPLLMEKYLRAAERITVEGLTIPPPPKPEVRRVLAKEFTAEPAGARYIRDRRFRALESGELRATVPISEAGRYRFRILAAAEPAGPELPRFTVLIDGVEAKAFALEKENNQNLALEHALETGERTIAIRFDNPHRERPPPPPAPTATTPEGTPPPRPATKVRRLGIEFLEIVGPLDRPPPPPPEAYQRLFTVQPGPDLTPREAARRILAPFAERAYRRPLLPAEFDKLLGLFDASQAAEESFEESIRFVVQALLVSPHFLFRVELRSHPLAGSDREELDSFALASRLSYFLWSSLPDTELFELARADRLRDPETLAAQVRRMLKDPRARALTENFAGQWLQLRSLATLAPDPERFPEFDDELRAAFATETELFFSTMVAENRPIGEFLTADFTFLNERLAKHYGIPGVTGPEFRRVRLETPQRGGLLTHGSILSVTSNPTRTSPVKRGKWILENLLAAPPPPPPPEAGDLSEDEAVVLSGTLRQRMEQHRVNPTCATCHARLDPLGFALENYDAIGRWRTEDGKFPIDPAGSLPDGSTFKDAAELRTVLAGRLEDLRVCLAEKLLTYALGRGLEATDRPYVLRLAESARQADDRLVELMVAVVQLEPFRFRLSEKR